jgi:hypothetical protein
MKEISKAIIKVMKEVRNVDKTMDVGSGGYGYKGVSDKVVKEILQPALANAGLCFIPIKVEAKTVTDRWEDNGRSKQSTLTEVHTKYLLLHSESGESIELAGYGQGVDNQDKGAGKATTYALKYALLYTFLIPTGTIDDTDTIHSDELDIPKVNRR